MNSTLDDAQGWAKLQRYSPAKATTRLRNAKLMFYGSKLYRLAQDAQVPSKMRNNGVTYLIDYLVEPRGHAFGWG